MTKSDKKHKKSKKDKKKKKDHSRCHQFSDEQFNIFGEKRDSNESVKTFGVYGGSVSKSLLSTTSIVSNTEIQH